jgi:hypothetical protein
MFLSEPDHRHAAPAELAFEHVPVPQSIGQSGSAYRNETARPGSTQNVSRPTEDCQQQRQQVSRYCHVSTACAPPSGGNLVAVSRASGGLSGIQPDRGDCLTIAAGFEGYRHIHRAARNLPARVRLKAAGHLRSAPRFTPAIPWKELTCARSMPVLFGAVIWLLRITFHIPSARVTSRRADEYSGRDRPRSGAPDGCAS